MSARCPRCQRPTLADGPSRWCVVHGTTWPQPCPDMIAQYRREVEQDAREWRRRGRIGRKAPAHRARAPDDQLALWPEETPPVITYQQEPAP